MNVDEILGTLAGLGSIINARNGAKRDEKKGSSEMMKNMSSERDEKGNITVTMVISEDDHTCCVCYEKLITDIHKCPNHHVICGKCSTLAGVKCPLCRSEIRMRATLMEEIIDKHLVKCENEKCKERMLPEDLKSHGDRCLHSKVKCPTCDLKIYVSDLMDHMISHGFSEVKYENNLDFLKDEKKSRIYIKSNTVPFFTIYIRREEGRHSLMCVLEESPLTPSSNLKTMTIDYESGAEEDGEVKQVGQMKFPICSFSDVVEKKSKFLKLPRNFFSNNSNICIEGFSEKYFIGSMWTVQDSNDGWYTGYVKNRVYNPDRVLIKFHEYKEDSNDEWIDLPTTRIRSIYEMDVSRMGFQQQIRHAERLSAFSHSTR